MFLFALKWKINLHRFRSSEGTLTSVCVYEPETIKLNTDHYFIEQYNRQRALQKHLCRCLLASWNLDQNLGETYEYVLEIADRPSRLGFPEGTLTSVCVYEPETIKLNTDHYFIEQYHRQRALQKHLCRCVLLRPIIWISCFLVIKIKEKRSCQFKNNISSYCRSSPSSGQDSNWLVLKVHSGINVLKGLVVCGTAQWNNYRYWFDRFVVVYTYRCKCTFWRSKSVKIDFPLQGVFITYKNKLYSMF